MKTNNSNNKPASKKIVWGSRDGYKKVVEACERKEKNCRLYIDNENEWMNAGITMRSLIRIVCHECGNDNVSVRLHNFITFKSYTARSS